MCSLLVAVAGLGTLWRLIDALREYDDAGAHVSTQRLLLVFAILSSCIVLMQARAAPGKAAPRKRKRTRAAPRKKNVDWLCN